MVVAPQPRHDEWWRGALLYQIYPRSFQDSNGDGAGDLAGIVSRLDYLEWLGVDAVWLNPTGPSPNDDWGYDVTCYRDVHQDFGTLDDLDRLIAEAAARGIRILLDLVPNHTSIQHRWFRERPDFYVWADRIPNNWVSVFGGSAWQLDPERGRYYLHNFLRTMPDLDWWNEAVREEFDAIMRFWLDRGVAGFRIDVAHGLVTDRELRDNPPAEPGDPRYFLKIGQRPVYNFNRPELPEVHARWRGFVDRHDPRLLYGETHVPDLDLMAAYNTHLHLTLNQPFVEAPFEAPALSEVVARTEQLLPAHAWPCWTASNHDVSRLATRWCEGDERRVRCALIVLLGLRGTPILYMGDELGLADGRVPPERVVDCATPPRDRARTPMQWRNVRGGGFAEPDVEPWLPLGDVARVNVEKERADPGSVLRFSRALVALRREFVLGSYAELPAPAGAWAWRRDGWTLAVNLGDEPVAVDGVAGEIALDTRSDRSGENVAGRLELGGWDGVVVRPSGS
jgi:alpha-glucosidase